MAAKKRQAVKRAPRALTIEQYGKLQTIVTAVGGFILTRPAGEKLLCNLAATAAQAPHIADRLFTTFSELCETARVAAKVDPKPPTLNRGTSPLRRRRAA